MKNIDKHGKEVSKPKSDYKQDVEIVKKIEATVGKDALNAAYFDGKIDVLKGNIDKRSGEGSYNKITEALGKKDYNSASKLLDRQYRK